MTFASPTTQNVGEEVVFKSYQDFQKRMRELDQVLKAGDALATLEYVDESLSKNDELSPKQLITEIRRYSLSRPSLALDYHAINEAIIVLLSAFLEGFIHELHAEAMRHLLNERTESSGVLEALLEYSRKQLGNPSSDRIEGLFNTCNIKNIISNSKTDRGTIDRFIKIRNKISHGEHPPVSGEEVESWVNLISKFAKQLSSVVEREIRNGLEM